MPAPWASTRPPPVLTALQRSQDDDFRIARRAMGAVMPQSVVDQFYRSSLELDASWIDRGQIDYCFRRPFDFNSLWASVWAIASQPFVDRFCVGVSQNASWRWARCDGHGSMQPHRDYYDRMFPLSAAWGDAASAMERLLQTKISREYPRQCVHTSYRRGPVRAAAANVLYLCVKFR